MHRPIVLLLLAHHFPAVALAQVSDDALAAKATDPIASLMSLPLIYWCTASLHDAE